ncbi:MAG: N-acetylmuramoyl-L-alanine amidase, partial [Kiritimatiellae bacterium]|nr:N-acetylmuramoyl-L-alanine amidase [Kiritimatiellia bacterium]
MSNSELATLTMLSPNWRERTHAIDTVTIHHTAAAGVSAAAIGQSFLPEARKASANYGIGYDGQIVLIVPEEKRAITSSSSANDNRAITIEVANSAGAPDWPISSDSWAALILLLT